MRGTPSERGIYRLCKPLIHYTGMCNRLCTVWTPLLKRRGWGWWWNKAWFKLLCWICAAPWLWLVGLVESHFPASSVTSDTTVNIIVTCSFPCKHTAHIQHLLQSRLICCSSWVILLLQSCFSLLYCLSPKESGQATCWIGRLPLQKEPLVKFWIEPKKVKFQHFQGLQKLHF